jgi:hypothetical protein
LKAKLYDLDENAEDAPRFVVDAYDHNLVVARLAEAERVIENAGCCLVMSNNGAREALNILRGYKQTADSASPAQEWLCDCDHPIPAQPVNDDGRVWCGVCGFNMPDVDPTPWCNQCGARKQAQCKCGPIADNE